MKLVRYGDKGREQPGMIGSDGVVRDLAAHLRDIDADTLSSAGLSKLRWLDPAALPAVENGIRLGVPILHSGKCLGIGANYKDHIEESHAPLPKEPIIFSKSDTAVNGPFDPVMQPKDSTRMDWEVELALVIGRQSRCVTREDALNHVAGYMLGIDYSEREFQENRGGQWIKGKGCDTFAPLGPWLVTTDEIQDPQDVVIWLEVNGRRYQECSTVKMIADCATIVSYCSQFMTLRPGDVILTGTPSGVGAAQDTPVYLQPGDVVRAGGSGLGEQQQVIIPWEPLPE